MILVAIYDKKGKTFGVAYTERNPEVAIRNFSVACQDKNTNLNKFPTDFILKQLGLYNEETGNIKPLKEIVNLASAMQFVVSPETVPNNLDKEEKEE